MPDPTRLDLLKDGYQEVLDATKHQDDKMGRLLTTVAFLIGGSLALGALAGATPLGRHFAAGDDRLPPLTLIAIVGFETCASMSALLLLYGLTTPLKVPGLPGKSTSGVMSQIFFLSIARSTFLGWEATWHEDQEDNRRQDALTMYIAEVYNLAVRTQFKYDRASEAVAVLSLALLGFACAVPLAFVGAASSQDPAEFGIILSLLVAGLLATYCFVTQLTRVRNAQLNTEDLRGLLDLTAWRVLLGRLNAVALAAAAAASVYVERDAMAINIVLAITLAVAVGSSVPTLLQRREGKFRKPRATELTSVLSNVLSCCACAAFAVTAVTTADRSWSLLAAVTLPIGVAFGALLGPAASTADRRRDALAV